MARTFNCGIGMILIVAAEDVDAVLKHAGQAMTELGPVQSRHQAIKIGTITERGSEPVVMKNIWA